MKILSIEEILLGEISVKECMRMYEKNIITIYKNKIGIITKEEI